MLHNDEIIDRCRYTSEFINDYFEERRYMMEVEQQEEITTSFLRSTAIDLVLSELGTLGIISNFSVDDFFASPIDLETLFYLRIKFDGTKFYDTIKALSEEDYCVFTDVIENIECPEDFLREIVEYFHGKLPLDVGWEYISNAMDYWSSTTDFVRHISAIIKKYELATYKQIPAVTDDNIGYVAIFLRKLAEEHKLLTVYINRLYEMYQDRINYARLRYLVDTYDTNKLKPDVIDRFAWYEANEDSVKEEPDYVTHHHEITNHHIEYWLKLDKEYTENKSGIAKPTDLFNNEIAIMCVFGLVLHKKTTQEIEKEIKRFAEIKRFVRDEHILMMRNVNIYYEMMLTKELCIGVKP